MRLQSFPLFYCAKGSFRMTLTVPLSISRKWKITHRGICLPKCTCLETLELIKEQGVLSKHLSCSSFKPFCEIITYQSIRIGLFLDFKLGIPREDARQPCAQHTKNSSNANLTKTYESWTSKAPCPEKCQVLQLPPPLMSWYDVYQHSFNGLVSSAVHQQLSQTTGLQGEVRPSDSVIFQITYQIQVFVSFIKSEFSLCKYRKSITFK